MTVPEDIPTGSELEPGTYPVHATPRAPVSTGRAATDEVVLYMEQLIFNGDLEPGDTLPSESELASTLKLSRLTVREGLRSLQARGLVEVNHGRRPMVAHANARPLRDFFSASVRRAAPGLLELLEVRLAIEVHATQLAAMHATRSDIDALKMALDAMRRAGNDEAAFNEADVRFHASVASASGNRMLDLLVEGMEEPLHDSRLNSLRGYRSKSNSFEALVDQHEEILQKIVSRDARGAAAAMRKHLMQTRKDLRTAFTSETVRHHSD